MGMFDYVRVEYPMPDPRFQNRIFQTKSFLDPYLDNFIITKEGRLLHDDYVMEEVPEEERPGYQDYKRTGNKRCLLEGMIRRRPDGKRDMNYHGDVIFYDFDKPENYTSGLINWRAHFSNGQLESIERIVDNEDEE